MVGGILRVGVKSLVVCVVFGCMSSQGLGVLSLIGSKVFGWESSLRLRVKSLVGWLAGLLLSDSSRGLEVLEQSRV